MFVLKKIFFYYHYLSGPLLSFKESPLSELWWI